MKWFEQVTNDPSNIVSSRVRLSRNWDEFKFPGRLTAPEAREMISRLRDKLQDLPERDQKNFTYEDLRGMDELDKLAMRERRLLNKTLVNKKSPGGILYAEDESVSLVLNGDDHIRLQVLRPGLSLTECYEEADRLDDYINEKIYYAFSDQYGYLTSYPTNVGTGMKASVVLHLPSLSASKQFQDSAGDMARLGAGFRGVFGRGTDNIGDLYEVYNQKTLGVTEKEILDLVSYVAGQLADQERRIRQVSLDQHRVMREDEAYKAYGVLKYARKLTMKEALTLLSHVRAGLEDEVLESAVPVSIYDIMLAIQPANLQKQADKPLNREELELARGRFVREHLPDLA